MDQPLELDALYLDDLINDFALRSFRDEGDKDYIAARMAFRAALDSSSLWASQQMIEKYLKCILLLNRIPAKSVKHDLGKGLMAITNSGKIALGLSPATKAFIEHADTFGKYRYLEVSRFASGRHLPHLDRTAWELRRFCALSDAPRKITLTKGIIPPKVRIPGGYLEQIIDNKKSPAREPLLWHNAFFGLRQRRRVQVYPWLQFTNAPLYLNPQILDEIVKYVYLPPPLVAAYKLQEQPQ